MPAYTKIDPEFKKKWVAALRSGRYRQGHGLLRQESSDGKPEYCCLGVAYNVATRGKGWTLRPGNSALTASGEGAYLNKEDAMYIPTRTQARLVQLNDGEKWDFKRIADWIEKYL